VRADGAVALALAALAAGCAHPLPPPAPGVLRVVFAGDSLVNRSSEDHGLLDLVRADLGSRLPGRSFELVNAGVNGDCIADIRARLDDEVLALDPAAVVLYWDSDAADVEDADEAKARAAALRAAYERNLDAVLRALRARTSHVVVAGPTLLGERPHGQNEKDRVLDAYATLNHRLAHEHQATWVDTRHAAFDWLRRHGGSEVGSRGILTEDGEHLNDAGARLVASELAAGLDRALRGRHEHEAEPTAPAAP
jgi:lysophospholipase L1-like esterase